MSVKVNYPDGLEEMVHGFKLCATARLFLQDLIPHVDAGIFLDNDIVVMDDLSLLWQRFKLFSTEAAMAMAPVEAHYGVRMVGKRIHKSLSIHKDANQKIHALLDAPFAGRTCFVFPFRSFTQDTCPLFDLYHVDFSAATADLILWSTWSGPQCWSSSPQLDKVKTSSG